MLFILKGVCAVSLCCYQRWKRIATMREFVYAFTAYRSLSGVVRGAHSDVNISAQVTKFCSQTQQDNDEKTSIFICGCHK